MSLKILIDMNLSPDWVNEFEAAGWHAVHWSAVGDFRATDSTLMAWARAENHIVFTHDLDFGTILALTHQTGPSVLQIRGEDILPETMARRVLHALNRHEAELTGGALVVIDTVKSRVRILPIQ